MLQWFAILTKRQEEHRACINLLSQGCTKAFYPTDVVTIVKRGKERRELQALFKRIVFAQFDPHDYATFNWGVIRSTRGCVDILKSIQTDGYPAPSPIRDSIVNALLDQKMDYFNDPSVPFKPGDKIEIQVGRFAGIMAKYLGHEDEKASLLIEFLGGPHIVTLPLSDLTKRAQEVG